METPADRVGQALVGDYELLNEVGRGGMGVVYRARHRSLGRIVALKLALRGESEKPDQWARFQIEAATIAQLDHPGIVPICEIGDAHDRPFFTMAFVEGQSLGCAVALRPLAPREAAEILVQVARAVACAHARGVIHRI